MTSHHQSDLDSNAADSVASSPRSEAPQHEGQPRLRFMCSFGGQILPRPHDNQLRYVGGDTRIVAVPRYTTYSSLLSKLSKLSGYPDITVKYQLPNEDLDALISVSTDEDVDNMMEEYDRLIQSGNAKTARLRLFLFTVNISRSSSTISSILEGSRREHWFFDALNGGSATSLLERGRSEASSIVSEVPDYLFGLDTIDDNRESKHKNRHGLTDNVSASDPGSPAPVVSSSPYCSTTSIPDLPPVKTKVENTAPVMEHKESRYQSETGEQFMPQQQPGYPGNNAWQYITETAMYPNPGSPQPMPVYYMPGPVPGTNIPVQVQRVPVQTQPQYIQRFPVGQVPVTYRPQMTNVGPVYGGGMRPVTTVEGYDFPAGVIQQDVGLNQNVYYGGRNAGVIPGYQATMVQMGTETQGGGGGGGGTEMKISKATQPH
ncbi:hypothetical protein ACHQM5_003507 [Ranunculus cassubicifolius]